MYYSAIGLLAILVLLTTNKDVLLKSGDEFETSAWKAYREFLLAILVYYATDVAWGLLEYYKLGEPLFLGTSVYFVAMAVCVLFWTKFAVIYLEEESGFGPFLLYAGRVICGVVVALVAVNFFTPVLFSIDEQCVYRVYEGRFVQLATQVALLVLVSVYAFMSSRRNGGMKGRRYFAISLFGLTVAVFVTAQLWFPHLPLYTVAYMLGTCLLHAFVVEDEKEEYRTSAAVAENKAQETARVAELQQSIASLFNNIPGMSFAKDAGTGVYVACNQAFAEYAHKESPEGVVGLTDAQIFDPETAKHFTDDDQLALSMDKPYVFFEDVLDAVGNQRQFQTTKLKYTDAYGRLCLLGMCADVTDLVRVQREYALSKEAYERERKEAELAEERAAYARINALTGDYICIYSVDPETGRYLRYISTENMESHEVPTVGEDFFDSALGDIREIIHPDDLDRYLALFNERTVLSEIERNGVFAFRFRVFVDGEPVYVQLKAAMIEEKDGARLIVGINDVDSFVRQEEEYARQLSQAKNQASLDALTGVKNRHAFAAAEEQLDHQIDEGHNPEFAVIVFDVNDLKEINDTAGHQAGDQCICDACKIICGIFSHSPVFRLGGDEFAVIAKENDYQRINELLGELADHNARALSTGGIIIACGMAKHEGEARFASVLERADQKMYENKSALKAEKQRR